MESVAMPFGGVAPASLAEAAVLLLPIPYEGAVSYGRGAGRGPEALLAASAQMELFDEDLLGENWRVGIHTLPAIEPNLAGPRVMLDTIRECALPLLRAGRPLIGIGGDHSVTVGLLEAHREVFGTGFTVLQLDAHADLRESYQGSPYSHACVVRRVLELGLPVVQVGVRSLSAGEWEVITGQGREGQIHWARPIVTATPAEREAWLSRLVGGLGERVYVSLDLDVLDPAVMPGTGTPEPGGLDYYTVLSILERVVRSSTLIGADLVELAPIPGQNVSEFTAARILYKLLGYLAQQRR